MGKSKKSARKHSNYKAKAITPDACKMLPPGTPALFVVGSDLGKCFEPVKNVTFNGRPAIVLNSKLPKCKGDLPGQGKGFVSQTTEGEVRFLQASSSVSAGGRRVVREGDLCSLNKGNCVGRVCVSSAPGGAPAPGGAGTPAGGDAADTADFAPLLFFPRFNLKHFPKVKRGRERKEASKFKWVSFSPGGASVAKA